WRRVGGRREDERVDRRRWRWIHRRVLDAEGEAPLIHHHYRIRSVHGRRDRDGVVTHGQHAERKRRRPAWDRRVAVRLRAEPDLDVGRIDNRRLLDRAAVGRIDAVQYQG